MALVAMPQLDVLRETLPEPCKDTRLNLGVIASSEFLDAEQLWGVALASAFYLREPRLRAALVADAQAAGAGEAVLEDAQAAASLMGMNTVFYRFRHLVGKESYKKPAGLRMQWMARPHTNKVTFELCSLAIAALAGCEMCIQAHEGSVLQQGLTEDHVHEAVRIASVLSAGAVALAGLPTN